jgi:hypothetical protein
MSAIAIDKQSALVLIAPQKGILALPDSRVAHPDVIVPGWCREAAGPQ